VAKQTPLGDRLAIGGGLTGFVFVGVSASVSPWLDHLYGVVTLWVIVPLAAWLLLRTVACLLDLDPALTVELWLSRVDSQAREQWLRRRLARAAAKVAAKDPAPRRDQRRR
jgi:hypothetical protein